MAIVGCLSGIVGASNFDVGVSGSDGGIDGFNISVGNYFDAPQQEIIEIERSLSRNDMSVVYFLARKSRNDVRHITDLRLSGMSWWDISYRLGLDPRTLYVVESSRHHAPPYGKAYGHKNKKYSLRDAEIVELVNVRFLSDHHRISADNVIDRRRKGDDYNRINERYSVNRSENRGDERSAREERGHGKKEHKNHHER